MLIRSITFAVTLAVRIIIFLSPRASLAQLSRRLPLNLFESLKSARRKNRCPAGTATTPTTTAAAGGEEDGEDGGGQQGTVRHVEAPWWFQLADRLAGHTPTLSAASLRKS